MPDQYTLRLGDPKWGILLDDHVRLKDPRRYQVQVPRGTLQSTDHVKDVEPGHRLVYVGKELFMDPAGEVVQLTDGRRVRYYLWSNGRVALLRMYGRDYQWHPFIRFSRLARLIGLRLPPEPEREEEFHEVKSVPLLGT